MKTRERFGLKCNLCSSGNRQTNIRWQQWTEKLTEVKTLHSKIYYRALTVSGYAVKNIYCFLLEGIKTAPNNDWIISMKKGNKNRTVLIRQSIKWGNKEFYWYCTYKNRSGYIENVKS